MLIISFDAVGDQEFTRLTQYPAFSALVEQSAVFRGAAGVFPSNTYPVHTSVVTGVAPGAHGILSNVAPFPAMNPIWITQESKINVKTIWQAAAEKGIDTAAVLWPATAYSRTIRYNIPEVTARPGKNQVVANLKAGSKVLQMKLYLRHRALLDGVRQPALDCFSTACMTDIIRAYKPGLALIHLIAYDSLCHRYGRGDAALETAFAALDENLGALLKAAGDGEDVILFSDHGQINVHTALDPNELLVSLGLLRRETDAYMPGESGCFIECCGGSAFFHTGGLSPGAAKEARARIGQSKGFRRWLTDEEMIEAGRTDAVLGFCAEGGYYYEAFGSTHKAGHGYPLDMPDYSVFYLVRGCGLEPGVVTRGGRLLDIALLAAQSMGLRLTTDEASSRSNFVKGMT